MPGVGGVASIAVGDTVTINRSDGEGVGNVDVGTNGSGVGTPKRGAG
jgi:hypothetical protein